MQDQSAELEWREGRLGGGIPVSVRFDDPYFSLDDGLAETRHVFLAGNGLPDRFGGDFQVAELGFGTGLNFLVIWDSWDRAGARGHLRFTTFEAYPMALPDMATALAAFPELSDRARALTATLAQDTGPHAFGPQVTLDIIRGDARQTLPMWPGLADAWLLDGFSPAKNPEMWGPDLMAEVARHTVPCGTAASYTAAGHVRRALASAGFSVTRQPGFGRKRHMTTARRDA